MPQQDNPYAPPSEPAVEIAQQYRSTNVIGKIVSRFMLVISAVTVAQVFPTFPGTAIDVGRFAMALFIFLGFALIVLSDLIKQSAKP